MWGGARARTHTHTQLVGIIPSPFRFHFIYILWGGARAHTYTHSHRYLLKPQEGISFPGAEITGDCELSYMGAGEQTQVLCKSSQLLPAKPSLQSMTLLLCMILLSCLTRPLDNVAEKPVGDCCFSCGSQWRRNFLQPPQIPFLVSSLESITFSLVLSLFFLDVCC